MSTKREFLKQLVGLAVAPMVPVPENRAYTVGVDLALDDGVLKTVEQEIRLRLSEVKTEALHAALMAHASKKGESLRLWLPGYHTPSLNRTAGKHWSKVRRMRWETALALFEALRETQVPKDWLPEARRVLARIVLKKPLEVKRGKKPPKPAVPPHLRIERVCCVLLDEENFKGGTKSLTDLLRYAFPTILLDDAPGYVVMEHVQTRCAKKCEEGTWVELRLGD